MRLEFSKSEKEFRLQKPFPHAGGDECVPVSHTLVKSALDAIGESHIAGKNPKDTSRKMSRAGWDDEKREKFQESLLFLSVGMLSDSVIIIDPSCRGI